jgi:hypothetical protein
VKIAAELARSEATPNLLAAAVAAEILRKRRRSYLAIGNVPGCRSKLTLLGRSYG